MIVMLFLFPSCSRKKQPMTDAITNRDSVPVMTTRGVSTYISDSGVVRYKIITKEWEVYDRLDPSRWAFEQGIYLEKFNNDLCIEATIVADTSLLEPENKKSILRSLHSYQTAKTYHYRCRIHLQSRIHQLHDKEHSRHLPYQGGGNK